MAIILIITLPKYLGTSMWLSHYHSVQVNFFFEVHNMLAFLSREMSQEQWCVNLIFFFTSISKNNIIFWLYKSRHVTIRNSVLSFRMTYDIIFFGTFHKLSNCTILEQFLHEQQNHWSSACADHLYLHNYRQIVIIYVSQYSVESLKLQRRNFCKRICIAIVLLNYRDFM